MLNFDDLQLIKLRSEVALAQSLEYWVKPSEYLQCPNCSSRNLGNKGANYNGTKKRYYCYGCERSFTELPDFDCSCDVPGRFPRCFNCPHFQEFLPRFQEVAKALQDKSFQDLELLLAQAQEQNQLRILRNEVARAEAFASWQQWQLEKMVVPELKCSHCQSLNFVKWGTDRGRKRYKCKNCDLGFLEPKLPQICQCASPGDHLECGKCADYERFCQLVCLLREGLQGLSLTELTTRLNQLS